MHIVSLYNRYAGRAVVLLAGVVMLAVFLYGGLLLGAVAHAAGETSAQRQVRELSVTVSELEAQYLAATKELSPERAAALGFVAPKSVATIYAAASTLTLAGSMSAQAR